MDRLIKRYDAIDNGDLMLVPEHGVAYQKNMQAGRVVYDLEYMQKCANYEGNEIARRVTASRLALVDAYMHNAPVLDIGVGCGEFIKARPNTYGNDVNPAATAWLKKKGLWSLDFFRFDGFTFWDVLEHVEVPEVYFSQIRRGAVVFCSLPIFPSLESIRSSKHYRPGEHLYYFTHAGFIEWMGLWGFELLEARDAEVSAGRESIMQYAFRRSLPDYHDTVGQYGIMYGKAYGASAWKLYFNLLAPEILKRNPKSILDYGCGHSDIASWFWADGQRRIERYDPAIPDYKAMPTGKFDLVLCLDVMEHILMADVDRVLAEITDKSSNVIFIISLRLARAKLPDGRNAHVTVLKRGEWLRWLGDTFGKRRLTVMPTPWDHVLMVRTF